MQVSYDAPMLKYQQLNTVAILVQALMYIALQFINFELFADIAFLYSYEHRFTSTTGIMLLWTLIMVFN